MTNTGKIVEALRAAQRPLTIPEIADHTGLDLRTVDGLLWGSPHLFVWQPGHAWAVHGGKLSRTGRHAGELSDSRKNPLVSSAPRELRAITLASGLSVRVSRRPLDSDAMFTVRSMGNVVELVLNSMHDVFSEFDMPFADNGRGAESNLLEVLLAAWALYEDSVPGGSARRALEDTRLLWGRRVVEVIRDSD